MFLPALKLKCVISTDRGSFQYNAPLSTIRPRSHSAHAAQCHNNSLNATLPEESPGPNSLWFHLINAQIASKAGEEEGGEEEEGGGGDVNPVGLWRQNISLQGRRAGN